MKISVKLNSSNRESTFDLKDSGPFAIAWFPGNKHLPKGFFFTTDARLKANRDLYLDSVSMIFNKSVLWKEAIPVLFTNKEQAEELLYILNKTF
jgi:hypothetical protein